MRVPVILHAISSFDQDILEMSAIPVLNSLSKCIAESEILRREIVISPDFWSILQRLRPLNTAAPIIFEILKGIVESSPPAVSSDNYESAVALANEFASAGSIGATEERRRDATARRSRGGKPDKSLYVICYHLSIFSWTERLILMKVGKTRLYQGEYKQLVLYTN